MTMDCRHCGKAIKEEAAFCEHCGERVMADDKVMAANIQPSTGMTQSSNGKIRWVYEMNMWKNPTLLITIWKISLLASLAPALLMFFLSLEQGIFEAIILSLKVGGMVVGIITALLMLAYPLVTIINGGKYCVVFEMDEKGIHHIQMQKQFKKSQTLAMIGAVVGTLAGSPSTIGGNLLAGSKQSLYTQFSKVKKIIVNKRRHVIYLNEALKHNQIYVSSEDFDYVHQFILKRCSSDLASA